MASADAAEHELQSEAEIKIMFFIVKFGTFLQVSFLNLTAWLPSDLKGIESHPHEPNYQFHPVRDG